MHAEPEGTIRNLDHPSFEIVPDGDVSCHEAWCLVYGVGVGVGVMRLEAFDIHMHDYGR